MLSNEDAVFAAVHESGFPGAEGFPRVEEHRLKPDSPTRRVVATCCNSAMFLDVTKGHWLSMYRYLSERRQ
jgi:hypothetical protein